MFCCKIYVKITQSNLANARTLPIRSPLETQHISRLKPPDLAQSIRILVWVKHVPIVLLSDSLVSQHLIIDSHILTLH